MTSSKPTSPSFIQVLSRIIGGIERMALVVSMLGFVFKRLQLAGASQLILLGLFTFSITLFLQAFLAKRFSNTLLSVSYKLGYISSAVGVLGILFVALHYPGAKELLTIALPTLAVVIPATIFLSRNVDQAFATVKPMLIKSTVILLAAGYLYMQLPTTH